MPMSSVKRITEFLKILTRRLPPPCGSDHHLFLYTDGTDGENKVALQVWTASSTRMVGFEDGDFDRPPEELAAEIIQLIEGKKNESSNEFTLS